MLIWHMFATEKSVFGPSVQVGLASGGVREIYMIALGVSPPAAIFFTALQP